MRPSELLLATQGAEIEGFMVLQRITTATKLCTIYHQDETLLVGFGGTRVDNFWDWLSNLNPEVEALELLPIIKRWLHIYQPGKVILTGHSQGGAHAEIVARFIPIPCEVVTFGGLPAGGVGTHYLVRSDPMAWLPIKRKDVVIKLVKRVLWPSFKGHDPKIYLEELQCRN